MDSGKSRSLETTVKRVYRDLLLPKINTSKKMSTLTNSPSSLEGTPGIKKNSGEMQAEASAERVKLTKSIKEKQNNELEKVALKRKADSEEKLVGKKEAKIMELDNQLVTTVPLPHIPLKNIMDVEMKLVYVDEEDVSYEFAQPNMCLGLQATGQTATTMPPASPRDLTTLPQIDKWLQVALKDASSCYRQKKYAVAAGQFRTALEVWDYSQYRCAGSHEIKSCNYTEWFSPQCNEQWSWGKII
ncbi:spermatogenesis associated 16, isoform CRA_a [Mus musculus]|nr:spermatogenesis associated 16, isoform CRA_a [Mus musculus]